VQTSYYNLVNAPLAIALGLLVGLAPLMRWRKQEPGALLKAALPAVAGAVVIAGTVAITLGVRDAMPLGVVFAAAFGLSANAMVTWRSFRAGWRHAVAYLGHTGVAVLLIGVVSSSGYGRSVQVQLPVGQQRHALGMGLTFQGVQADPSGKDRALIAVSSPDGRYRADPALYWSEFNQAYMKKPHIQRYLSHDVYISPLEMVGGSRQGGMGEEGVWFSKGESKKIGEVTYTFVDFDRQMGEVVRIAARMRAEIGGRTVPVRPVLEINLKNGIPNRIPDYLPGGASVTIANVDPNTGRVALELPGMSRDDAAAGNILAVEVSTKPLINLVWVGAILMLGSAFLSMFRRALDVRAMGKPAS
jgi:cytochrome c-type biogenesis protein CcmF